MDGIVENVEHLVTDKFGTWLVQTAVKVSETAVHVFQLSAWIQDNILDVYCDPHTMYFATSVIEVQDIHLDLVCSMLFDTVCVSRRWSR